MAIEKIILVGEQQGKYIGFEVVTKPQFMIKDEPIQDEFIDYMPTTKLYNNSYVIYRREIKKY